MRKPSHPVVILSLLVLVLALSACAPAASQALPATVEIGLGEEVVRNNVSVRFNTVIEDSRCPADAVCIQAGQARVSVTVTVDGQNELLALTNVPDGGQPVEYQGYRISLQDLQPYPLASQPTDPDAYQATILIEEA
jgi:hypothetical protein